MYQLIGKESKEIYVKGRNKSDCFRNLHRKYPTLDYSSNRSRKKGRTVNSIYPEALILIRKNS